MVKRIKYERGDVELGEDLADQKETRREDNTRKDAEKPEKQTNAVEKRVETKNPRNSV